jgi:hypothetical protein
MDVIEDEDDPSSLKSVDTRGKTSQLISDGMWTRPS